LEHFYSSAC